MLVTVLGAGTMGHGIAQVTAMAGHEVRLRDIETGIVEDGIEAIEENLEEGVKRDKVTEEETVATLDRISGTTSLPDAVSDAALVIEAVPEEMDLKQDTFEEIEANVPADVLIASNTSSLSLTEIASVLDHPGRAIGLHFFNPVHIMQLVEIIVAEQTRDTVVETAHKFVEGIGKTPVEVTDFPGFTSSRLGVSLGVEAIRMVQEGVAFPRDIDTAMELGYNHPVGPLELTDVVGLDVRLNALEYLHRELGERFRPPQLLKRKVQADKLGKKTGEGFYVWEDGEIVGTGSNRGDSQ